MRVLLISTYELGHQPFGIASPAAWLKADGHAVDCADTSIEPLSDERILRAEVAAIYLPMHTATRLAIPLIQRIRRLSPQTHLCCFGLYAPLNAEYLHSLGVEAVLGGEFEADLVQFVRDDRPLTLIALERLRFQVPDRAGLPSLDKYPGLRIGGERKISGYVEASRGCKHLCRHCPIVPVYRGSFRVVPREIVLADIRRQVFSGAEHITFGDPDFFNGPTHALKILEEMHEDFPHLTYDATIKIEHLRKHRDLLPVLKETGCLFVTSAVESLDDAVLGKLRKGHTRSDFVQCVKDFRKLELTLSPTFIAFMPWTTLDGYRDLLRTLAQLGLAASVGPVQLALRLLIPNGSRMLELAEIRALVKEFDHRALLHRWEHLDPAMDKLAADALDLVQKEQKLGTPRLGIFRKLWELAGMIAALPENFDLVPRAAIPYLNEPWYC